MGRPIYKHDVKGIDGTLYYDYEEKVRYLPESRREIDRRDGPNEAERALYARLRESHEGRNKPKI